MMLCNIMECHCNVQCLLLYYVSEVGNEKRPPQLTYSRHQTAFSWKHSVHYLDVLYYEMANYFTRSQ